VARIRSIKPEFFRHERLYEAEKDTGFPLRVAFAGLWTSADREGRFRWSPRALKLDCLPYDEVDFSRVLDALVTRGFIIKYRVDDTDYGVIPSFTQHQVINNRESASKLPEPNENNALTRDARVLDASVTPLVQDLGEGKGKEGKGTEYCPDAKASRTKQKYSEEFETKFWLPYPRSPTMAKTEAWREWMKLTPDQRSAACQAIEPFKKYLRSKPKLETVHACRFLSQQRFDGFVNGATAAQPAPDIRSSLV
jgi:hypothetical protein